MVVCFEVVESVICLRRLLHDVSRWMTLLSHHSVAALNWVIQLLIPLILMTSSAIEIAKRRNRSSCSMNRELSRWALSHILRDAWLLELWSLINIVYAIQTRPLIITEQATLEVSIASDCIFKLTFCSVIIREHSRSIVAAIQFQVQIVTTSHESWVKK